MQIGLHKKTIFLSFVLLLYASLYYESYSYLILTPHVFVIFYVPVIRKCV